MRQLNHIWEALLVSAFVLNASAEEVLVSVEHWGSNLVSVTRSPVEVLDLETDDPRRIADDRFVRGFATYLWKLRLYLGSPTAPKSKVLWERVLESIERGQAPRDVRVLGYHIEPDGNCAVVFSQDYLFAHGDIIHSGGLGLTNVVSKFRNVVFSQAGPSQSNPAVAAKVSPGPCSGIYDAHLTLRNGGNVEVTFTGHRWRFRPPGERRDAAGQIGETVIYDRADGLVRVVFSYTIIDDREGLRLTSKSQAGRAISGFESLFDRRYRLTMKAEKRENDLVLWEKLIASEGYGVISPANSSVNPLSSPGLNQPNIEIVKYFVDITSDRCVVVFRIGNSLFGEIAKPGRNGAEDLSGVRPFSLFSASGRTLSSGLSGTVTAGKMAASYEVRLDLGAVGKTNVLFDGSKWIPERIELK